MQLAPCYAFVVFCTNQWLSENAAEFKGTERNFYKSFSLRSDFLCQPYGNRKTATFASWRGRPAEAISAYKDVLARMAASGIRMRHDNQEKVEAMASNGIGRRKKP